MDRLSARPEGLLVSAETAHDFVLHPGDQVRLRLTDALTGQLRTVPFRFEGVVKEFPTAPKDSFLVANASYIARTTGSDAPGTLLVDTRGTGQRQAAAKAKRVLGPSAHVTDLPSSQTVVGSSLTAVDLAGLARVELGFALVIGAAAGGLVLALGLAECRRTNSHSCSWTYPPRRMLPQLHVETRDGPVGASSRWDAPWEASATPGLQHLP